MTTMTPKMNQHLLSVPMKTAPSSQSPPWRYSSSLAHYHHRKLFYSRVFIFISVLTVISTHHAPRAAASSSTSSSTSVALNVLSRLHSESPGNPVCQKMHKIRCGGSDEGPYYDEEEEEDGEDDDQEVVDDEDEDQDDQDVFDVLASTVRSHSSTSLKDNKRNNYKVDSDNDMSLLATSTIPKLSKTLKKLSQSQSTFKGLDGMAHEAYQRTHSSSSSSGRENIDFPDYEDYDDEADDSSLTSVAGRAQRSLARLRAVTEAFEACELVEIAELGTPQQFRYADDTTSTPEPEDPVLEQRQQQVIFNTTLVEDKKNTVLPLSVVVLFDPNYDGGAGLDYGNTDVSRMKKPRGRLLVVLSDPHARDMEETISILNSPKATQQIRLSSGLVANEVASVQRCLYKTAGEVLEAIEGPLREYYYDNSNTNTKNKTDTSTQSPPPPPPLSPAIHFVGHSLAGGVACLASTICDGSIPMPKMKNKRNTVKTRSTSSRKVKTGDLDDESANSSGTTERETGDGGLSSSPDLEGSPDGTPPDGESEVIPVPPSVQVPICGIGRGRSSAVSLGGPPCLSSNVVAAFCTSILFGDDIVCRTTSSSYEKLVGRVNRNLHGGFIGKKLGWMSDTISLTVSSLQSHAHGSEGEEIQLSTPGRAYLIRPRRIGGTASIHEVGSLKNKGGRDAIREALLWQLNDILLSKSMWKHHSLESYIHGLDRVQLRGTAAAAATATSSGVN